MQKFTKTHCNVLMSVSTPLVNYKAMKAQKCTKNVHWMKAMEKKMHYIFSKYNIKVKCFKIYI